MYPNAVRSRQEFVSSYWAFSALRALIQFLWRRRGSQDRLCTRTSLLSPLCLRSCGGGAGIRYTLSRWDGLTRFLDDGRIEIDSNVVERTIRPIALNRKNALFAGSDGGGDHWAVIASLIETCKLIGADPHAYLTDVITKLVNGHLNSRIDELLPWAHPAVPAFRHVA